MASRSLRSLIHPLLTITLITATHALLFPGNLPDTWVSKGCYTDVDRTLSGDATADGLGMTGASCVSYCSQKGYIYAGAESGSECYCGNSIAAAATELPASECNIACVGNTTEACGGPNQLNIFWSGNSVPSKLELRQGPISTTSTSSSASATATPYTSLGCYTESTTGRALSGAAFFDDLMTIELCGTKCSAFTYFGVEYGRECYCGNAFTAGSVPAAAGDCSFNCPGNALEKCGAGNRLSVWSFGAIPSSSSVTQTSTTGSTTVSSISTAIPTGWEYRGCYVEGTNGRLLTHQSPDMVAPNGLTLQKCIAYCTGYTIVGLEFGQQCFCDNAIHNGGVLAASDSECSVPCAGDSTRKCGGGNRVSLYSIGEPQVYQPPAPQKTGLPANWKYVGCLQDNQLSKPNPYADPVTGVHESIRLRTFPYAITEDKINMTATACITKCQQFGYNAAGIEVGTQCFCGDSENILIASDPYTDPRPIEEGGWQYDVPPVVVTNDNECSNLCSGDSQYYCGANDRLVYYTWNGTEPLYSWDIPEGNNAGEYSLLIGGVTVPLITSQLITGKVSFVQKTGTNFRNGTGVYELDLTQIDNFSAAWRQMDQMQTDVFCAAGLTLPDKVGRQLTVAGWNFASNWGVRLYWPDGSDGVKGTNQWQESPEFATLQLPRWYPSAIIMANGSILIVGGEVSQNDKQQPFLELLPPTGVPLYNVSETYSGYSNTTVYLDFLERTHPNNLYPFLAVLPSGGIFVGYFNEARILDEVNFQTIKTLPNIPGAVNNDQGGRTYQLEGTMVTLPQHAPYTDPLGVLICGGSTPNEHMALDNCVTIEPDAPNPVWTIERMPSRRVMSCMAGLPDGTYLILNGGQHGAAGFGLAGEPNYNAVLYDPRKPLNSRMSIMANTTVPRMYHSEAITLLDGRVLVSGSDPSGNDPNGENGVPLPVDPNIYPEEFRVEVFTPPYLLSGLPRPTFTIANKDWSYGQSITFSLGAAVSGAVKVSLLGSVVSTHGNNMGQRTLFPSVSCSGTSCTVTAPPNAHICPPGWFMMFVLDGPTPSVGVFVRIGGDPAELGNWPNVPGVFDLPGI